MSVYLQEVLESVGIDIRNIDDAKWLLSQQDEFEYLIEEAKRVIEESEDE